ncbi:MAG: endonuclease domain-containing protein [Hyphomicrobiales bacterium]
MINEKHNGGADLSPSPAGEGVRRATPDGWGKRPRDVAPSLVKTLRRNLTPQEAKLWVRLKELKSQGLHFRKQVPIKNYIIDFAYPSRKLLIEVDGEQYGFDAGLKKDRNRDFELETLGFRVLRFWNHEVDREIEGVLDPIWRDAVDSDPHPSNAKRSTPSPAGEGGV